MPPVAPWRCRAATSCCPTAEPAGASLVLNEFAESRAGILSQLFPAFSTTQFDAAHINDHVDAGIVPSVVLMNPPFSAAVHVDRQMADASFDIGSASFPRTRA